MFTVRVICIISISCLCSGSVNADEIYSVVKKDRPVWTLQLGAFSSAEAAYASLETIKSQLSDPPLEFSIRNDSGLWRVTTGNFALGAGAFSLREDLRKLGIPSVMKISKSDGKIVAKLYESKLRGKAFKLPRLSESSDHILDGDSLPQIQSMVKSADVQTLYPRTRVAQYKRNNNRTIDENSIGSSPMARLLAIDNLTTDDKVATSAIALYSDLASSVKAVDPYLSLAAMKSASDVQHYFSSGKHAKLESLQMYIETAQFAKQTKCLAYHHACLVEIAGLVTELAQSGIGELEDVLTLTEHIKSVSSKQDRAYYTARLLECEYWNFKKKPDQAVVKFEELLSEPELAQFPREHSMALFFYGVSLRDTSNYSEALRVVDEIIDMEIPVEEYWQFKNNVWNMKLRALSLGSVVAAMANNADLMDSYMQRFNSARDDWGKDRSF